MVGTVFLLDVLAELNGGAAASGDAQQRAIINTYSLCSCTIAIISCLVSGNRRMSMEHLQKRHFGQGRWPWGRVLT